MNVGERLAGYRAEARRRLERTLCSSGWREVLANRAFLRTCERTRIPAASPPSQLRGVPAYLIEANTERVRSLIQQGITDRAMLVEALGDWRTALARDARHPLLFLGLTVTTRCSFKPRCVYCNQQPAQEVLSIERLKALVTEAADPRPPYVYLTGGEPLLLGEAVWGPDGLAAHAASLGCAVNINTNAALITPRVAINLVRSGVSRLHISLDAATTETQADLFGSRERVRTVWRGMMNVLIARAVLDTDEPKMHINCVITNRNYFEVPDLLRDIWQFRPVTSGGASLDDFAFHLIPVGGQSNEHLRPSAEQWREFFTDVWDRADAFWQEEQEKSGVAAGEQRALKDVVPFANPYLRVDHGMSLDEYCQMAARGVYWQGALCESCWVAPSQACVLADGSQHWCGGHAIRRPPPMGNCLYSGLRENIRASLHHLDELPNSYCTGCAGATCVINQATRSALREHVESLLAVWRGEQGCDG